MAESATYRVPAASARGELREKGSRFLAIVEPSSDREQAAQRIEGYEKEFRQATHVCWAWRIGWPAAEGRSDAGEPTGTAGVPMLQVLRGAGLSDVLAVVVRWFGGIKLGKGGLARAYAGAVQEALEVLPVELRRPVAFVKVRLKYEHLGDLKRWVHPPAIEIVDEQYGDEIDLLLRVEHDRVESLVEDLGRYALTFELAGV